MSKYDADKMSLEQLYQWAVAHALPVEEIPRAGKPTEAYEADLRVRVKAALNAPQPERPAQHVMAIRKMPVRLGPKCEPMFVDVRVVDQREIRGNRQVRISPLMGTGEVWISESRLQDADVVVEV